MEKLRLENSFKLHIWRKNCSNDILLNKINILWKYVSFNIDNLFKNNFLLYNEIMLCYAFVNYKLIIIINCSLLNIYKGNIYKGNLKIIQCMTFLMMER